MTTALLRQPDHISRIALFGARFVDAATGRGVSDGLTVTVYPKGRPDRRRDAICNRSGVFALQRVPGLDRLEPPDLADPLTPLDLKIGDASFWQRAIAASAAYIVEVRDRDGRFLPVSYATSIPTPGPYGTGAAPTGLPAPRTLYSAPARTPPPAVGVIRGELRKRATATEKEKPLAHALLVVETGAAGRHLGIADASGRVAVMFNLPEPLASPGALVKPFVWSVRVSIHHGDLPAAPPGPREALPDLDRLLGQETAPRIKTLADLLAGSTAIDRIDAELHFGKELVLRTLGSSFLFASAA